MCMADQYVLDVWLRVSRMIWINQDVIAPKNPCKNVPGVELSYRTLVFNIGTSDEREEQANKDTDDHKPGVL